MSDCTVHSHAGIGPLRFGMPYSQVREIIGGEFRSFKRSPTATWPCDHFADKGLIAYYDASGELEAVEVARPGHAYLDGMDLLGMSFAQVRMHLEGRDTALELDGNGLISRAAGVSVYAPHAKEDTHSSPKSALIFARGYYD